MIFIETLLVGTFLYFTVIRWAMGDFRRENKKAVVKNISGDPYRTPAEVPAPEPAPKPIEQPKPKRELKMNLSRTGEKVLHCFLWMMPVAAAAVGIGFLYDLSLFGVGLRTGLGFAAGFIGIFCFIMMLHTATDGFKG